MASPNIRKRTQDEDREMREFRRQHRERKLKAIRANVEGDAAGDELVDRIARSPDAPEPLPDEDVLPDEIDAFVIAYRLLGRTVDQIAEELALPKWRVDRALIKARASAKLMDVEHLLQHVALPLAADQLIAGVRSGDKDYVLETLKGRGALRQHTKNDGGLINNGNVLNVTFELPPGVDPHNIADGAIVGVERVIDGETVDA